MLQLPGKHVLFAFSDPAGANACMAMAEICSKQFHQQSTLVSNKSYTPLLNKKPEQVQAVPALRNKGVDCVFTGTSHPASSQYFEVNCIREARAEEIFTVSFVDHWVNFRLRFQDENAMAHYPDQIWVVDEYAKQLAIKEGLPESKLVVSGNPYHHFLKEIWQPVNQGRSYLSQLGIPVNRPVILYAPDPVSLRSELEPGFDEASALEDLLQLLPLVGKDITLVVKCHPLQPMKVFEQLQQQYNEVYFVTAANTLELLNASDLVIGFYSNILLEAAAMGKKTLRYFPGNEAADLLRHHQQLPLSTDPRELLHLIKNCINE